jgi:hypothetical protein
VRERTAEALLLTGLVAYVPLLLVGVWWTAGGVVHFLASFVR